MADRAFETAAEHLRAGRLDQAREMLARHLHRFPRDGRANSMMAGLLGQAGDLSQAETFGRRAVESAPGLASGHFNLGHVLSRLGRHEGAAACFAQAARLNPRDVAPARMHVSELVAAWRLADALDGAARGLAAFPGDVELLGHRSQALLSLGRAGEAVAALREGAASPPEGTSAVQMIGLARTLAATAIYDAGVQPAELLALHRRAGDLLSRSAPDRPRPRTDGDPDRRLRIGFLSADLCNHVVAVFLAPALTGLDRGRFTIACYSTAEREDAVSDRLRTLVDLWRHAPPTGFSPAALERTIRADAIDILIDLGGYTGQSPIDVMALRPAPVQVTYLGYANSTGLDRIDYRIVDSRTDPAGEPYRADEFATERLVRLDPCFLCFRPAWSGLPEPGRLRHGTGGAVAFGSFNALQKINGPLVRLWRRVLEAVPGSTLTLKNPGLLQEAAREACRDRLVEAGLDAGRIALLGPEPEYTDHLRVYHRIDIALDTYPYCGTTTTCESLFMGVPVVSLVGRTHASRVGLSLLSAVGLEELATESEEHYIRTAAGLAGDRARLDSMRAGLRERMLASSLCDADAFACRFGEALRGMWRESVTAGW